MARIRLRYVSGDVDRHGNPRWYFRRPGQPKIRLRGLPGSEEFMATYKAALAGEGPPTAAKRKGKPSAGTLRWLCAEYFTASPFTNKLGARTRGARRRMLEKVCETAGDELVSAITTR
jgi:hypothetical protein